MGWSSKYKKSIDCNNPKGFSQKAHCAGKKKRNERVMKLSEFKEAVTKVLRERSINAISKLQQKNVENIAKALEFYKKNKHTDKREPFIKLLKKLGKEKESLAKELDMKVSGMYKNAEYKGESVNEANYKVGDTISVTLKGGKKVVKGKVEKLNPLKVRTGPTDVVTLGNHLIQSIGESVNEGYGKFIKAKNLTDIVALSKKKKNAVFYVTDDNNSRIGTFYLKNGKFAKATSANPNYDLQNSKTKLKDRSDVIYKYKVDESVNEGASSEEKRIAMLAVKKQAKYRNVSLSQAIQDQINALEELKRQYKGK